MDGKGKQKVKVICLILGVTALIVTVFVCKVLSENRILEEQKRELSIIYPEIADGLNENIEYYAGKNIRIDILIMVALILLTGIALAVTYYLFTSSMKYRIIQVEMDRGSTGQCPG